MSETVTKLSVDNDRSEEIIKILQRYEKCFLIVGFF